jgi:uncharacterized protein (TIGR02466 family)
MTIQIHGWFPRPICVVDNVLTHELKSFENRSKEIVDQKSYRNNVLNVNSTHTTNSNLHFDPIFNPLVSVIYSTAKEFMVEVGYHQFLNSIKINSMWTNVSQQGDFLYPHIHGSSLISGAYYVKAPVDSKIKFFNNITDMVPPASSPTPFTQSYCEYDCTPGRLIMFRSDFLHGTGKQPEGEKIVISFNISTGIYE